MTRKEKFLNNKNKGKKNGQNRTNIDGKSSAEISDFFMESDSGSETEDSSEEVENFSFIKF